MNPSHLAAAFMMVAILSSGPAGATEPGEISGVVTSEEFGSPLIGVVVELSIQDAAGVVTRRESRTDTGGYYQFTDVDPGEVLMTFRSAGFLETVRDFTLDPGQKKTVDLGLALDAFELEEVVVSGGGRTIEEDLQTGYLDLDAGTLDMIPGIVEPDPLRALQMLPGIQAASDISSGLYIRGGGPDQTLVQMDGVTVYNPTHAFGFFSTFNNDLVNNVALYKGAYPAQYGGRLGSVLDVQLRRPQADGVHGKVGISLISARAVVEGNLGPDHWMIGGRRSFLEPLLEAIRTPEDPIPSYFFYDFNAIYTTERLGGRTTFSYYGGKDEIYVDADQYTKFDLTWGNTVAYLRHERRLSETVDGSLTAAYSRYKSLTTADVFATPFDVDNDLTDVTLTAAADWRAAENHRISGGVSQSWYEFVYRQDFNLERLVDYGSKPSELVVYAEDRWFLDEFSTLRAGARYRWLSQDNRQYLEPRFAYSRQVRPDVRLKVGGGIYNQYMQLVTTEGFSAGDFYVPIDDSAPLGRSYQLVLGSEWDIDLENFLSLEVYATDLDNVVEFDNRVPVDQESLLAEDLFVTGGKGYARGIEAFWKRRMGRTTGWLGYTLGWTEREFAELNGGEPFPPKYDRRHDLNAVLSHQAGSWTLNGAFRYATGQAYTPASARYVIRDPGTGQPLENGQVLAAERNSARLLPYHRLDISARRPIGLFGLDGEFVFEIFNLYNRRNEWFVTYDTEDAVTKATVVRMLPIIPSIGINVAF